MHKLFLLIIAVILFVGPIFGQGIKIFSGKKKQQLPFNQEVSITIGDYMKDTISRDFYKGILLSQSKDSIQLDYSVNMFNRKTTLGSQSIRNDFDNSSIVWISKKDVFSIYLTKDKSTQKKSKFYSRLGMILIGSGIVTTANTLLVKDKSDISNLLIAGGSQFLLGTTLSFVSFKISPRSFRFKEYKGRRRWHFAD